MKNMIFFILFLIFSNDAYSSSRVSSKEKLAKLEKYVKTSFTVDVKNIFNEENFKNEARRLYKQSGFTGHFDIVCAVLTKHLEASGYLKQEAQELPRVSKSPVLQQPIAPKVIIPEKFGDLEQKQPELEKSASSHRFGPIERPRSKQPVIDLDLDLFHKFHDKDGRPKDEYFKRLIDHSFNGKHDPEIAKYLRLF